MKLDFVRKEVKEYINSVIKPVYKTFDKAHSTSHFNFVTKNCVDYGKELIEKDSKLNQLETDKINLLETKLNQLKPLYEKREELIRKSVELTTLLRIKKLENQ